MKTRHQRQMSGDSLIARQRRDLKSAEHTRFACKHTRPMGPAGKTRLLCTVICPSVGVGTLLPVPYPPHHLFG